LLLLWLLGVLRVRIFIFAAFVFIVLIRILEKVHAKLREIDSFIEKFGTSSDTHTNDLLSQPLRHRQLALNHLAAQSLHEFGVLLDLGSQLDPQQVKEAELVFHILKDAPPTRHLRSFDKP